MNDETRDTIDEARRGDKHALEHLLTRQRGQLERVAQSRLDDERHAHIRLPSLLQSTFLEVAATIGGFRGDDEQAFGAWVETILENNVKDAGQLARPSQPDADPRAASAAPALPGGPASGPNPSAEVILSDELMLVTRAMAELSEDYRRIILFRLTRGGTHEDVARALGRSTGATRVLLARARAALLLEVDHKRRAGARRGH